MAHQPKYVGPEWLMNPIAPLAAGKAGTPQVLTGTSVKGVGKIVFSANPIADTTTSVGGVTFTWKASATLATEVTIGVDLSTSISNLISKLQANATLNALATYTKTDTNTALTVTMKVYGVEYNGATGLFPLASTTATPTITQVAGSTNEQVVSLDTKNTEIRASLGVDHAINLYAGDEFQEKVIHLAAKTGAGGAVVTGVFQGGTTLTFNAVGDFVRMIYLNAKWQVVDNVSVTLA